MTENADPTAAVREAVLLILSTPGADTRAGDQYLGAAVRERTGCHAYQVWEAVWSLVGDGLVYLHPKLGPPEHWPFRLSSEGIEVAGGVGGDPRDPEGYLQRLDRQVPGLDPRARVYVAEAVRAFAGRCYLASSVMLGVAAEQVFLILAEAVATAIGPQAQKLRKELDNPRSSQRTRFTELRKVLNAHGAQFPDHLVDTLTLDAVGDLLRVTRNEAGHPTGHLVDQDTARAHLLIATSYLRKMTELRLLIEDRAGEKPPATDA